jgi:hypothetical protein
MYHESIERGIVGDIKHVQVIAYWYLFIGEQYHE